MPSRSFPSALLPATLLPAAVLALSLGCSRSHTNDAPDPPVGGDCGVCLLDASVPPADAAAPVPDARRPAPDTGPGCEAPPLRADYEGPALGEMPVEVRVESVALEDAETRLELRFEDGADARIALPPTHPPFLAGGQRAAISRGLGGALLLEHPEAGTLRLVRGTLPRTSVRQLGEGVRIRSRATCVTHDDPACGDGALHAIEVLAGDDERTLAPGETARVTAPETGAEWTISVARATEFACDECECFVDSDLALAITVEPAR
ncbi:MAG TPA: hypothetical protein RMH85_12555 [Polyangiaceae bacterium LLY-WYZ-15_(1-7)]|nr:hypothetical protein [Sandaracinus sp.]HJL04033.1 hypothetical protein [Polyangiaceae bacterium LLY-WYZ-15_(1-7)]HJL09328.1 hypothetical protein [Polyangiaceae bacterium LLY-WYZ-15_(1-7)]HJL26362.1 hypothetical protein [Polyangiaceae bacterium LLY-WYZ-15_(1-7)]HJL37933.1 hypothetical protein [Polyangiaceae bacterium LLY-WYZ-15_(1-7)]